MTLRQKLNNLKKELERGYEVKLKVDITDDDWGCNINLNGECWSCGLCLEEAESSLRCLYKGASLGKEMRK